MRIITRYIATTTIISVFLVILFLFGLHIFVEFIREFSTIGQGNYNIPQVLAYVFLMLPADIYQFFPMAALLGFIIALGLLASHSELIVMRAAGMSVTDIASVVIKVGIVLIIIMFFLGEVLSPMAQRKAAKIRTAAISGGKALITNQGIWLYHQGEVTNINSLTNKGELQGVTTYKIRNNLKLQEVSYAASGFYREGRWIFNQVATTGFQDKTTTSNSFSELPSTLKFNPKLIGTRRLDTDKKSLTSLYTYIKYRKQIGLDTTDYLLGFWQRIFSPFAILVMTLLALPFVFGSLRSATMGSRMLIGIMFGFSFYILHQFVGPMSVVYLIPPIVASILPLLIFAIVGGLLLYRVR